jgi:hypothetical protein
MAAYGWLDQINVRDEGAEARSGFGRECEVANDGFVEFSFAESGFGGTTAGESSPAVVGRRYSLTTDCFREVEMQGRLCGDES